MTHDDLTLIAEAIFNDKSGGWKAIYDVHKILIDDRRVIIDSDNDTAWKFDRYLDIWIFGSYEDRKKLKFFPITEPHLSGFCLGGDSKEVKTIIEMLEMMEV